MQKHSEIVQKMGVKMISGKLFMRVRLYTSNALNAGLSLGDVLGFLGKDSGLILVFSSFSFEVFSLGCPQGI